MRVGVDDDARLVRETRRVERRLRIPRIGHGAGSDREGREPVREEESHLLRARARPAPRPGEPRQLAHGEAHAGREVRAAVGAPRQDGGDARLDPLVIRSERDIEPRVLLIPAHALPGLRVHLPREADHADAHPRGIQAVDERLRGLDLGGEDRVARVRRLHVGRIAAGLHQLELRVEADLPVPVHVDAARRLRRSRHVDDDHHVEVRRALTVCRGAAADRRLMHLVAQRLAGLRALDQDAHGHRGSRVRLPGGGRSGP